MAFGRKQEIENLGAQLDQRDERIAELQEKLAAKTVRNNVIEHIAQLVDADLHEPSMQAQLDDDAYAMARVEVFDAERERLTTELGESIRNEKYDEFVAKIRVEEGPK